MYKSDSIINTLTNEDEEDDAFTEWEIIKKEEIEKNEKSERPSTTPKKKKKLESSPKKPNRPFSGLEYNIFDIPEGSDENSNKGSFHKRILEDYDRKMSLSEKKFWKNTKKYDKGNPYYFFKILKIILSAPLK